MHNSVRHERRQKHLKRLEDYDSLILTATHFILDVIVDLTMSSIYFLLGIRKDRISLRHAEVFLVTTTAVILLMIEIALQWSQHVWFGWLVVVFGNLRILQIVSLNLRTLLFDVTTVGEPMAALKRARWHFVAIGFSFIDTVIVFGYTYHFLDRHYGILNQHFEGYFNYFYYAVITITTIGYGDIHPVNILGKVVVMYEAILALFFLVFFVNGALARLHRH